MKRIMKLGDTVRFKNIVDKGDEIARMILLEHPNGGRVLVQDNCNLWIKPTRILSVKDLEVVEYVEIECPACYGKGFTPQGIKVSTCSICKGNKTIKQERRI